MAPVRTKKRASGESQSRVMTVPTKTVTERARRLRAQYNLQAQGLRSRVEIRVNRIPISLRKMTMGDLVAKFEQQQQRTAALTRAPPVPAKDAPSRLSPQKSNQSLAYPSYKPIHGYKRTSVEYTGPDKENELGIENPKKRARGANVTAAEQAQILSPTSSNSRLTPRKAAPASPSKSLIARPASPTKPTTVQRGAGLLSSMVEKAKATRAAGVRKATTTSTISSSSSSAAASSSAAGTTRGRKAGTTTGSEEDGHSNDHKQEGRDWRSRCETNNSVKDDHGIGSCNDPRA
ncbi:unnamed protein product [Parascedosporium putredinis]|uniref:Borealin N-terminal domain-containing protein n=1 Tax=Parascedosporium putredinis TaxID=1442378 RepID=A0A9P1MB23_9PEZI|nr:unnamed protein product [Parascedosporium putredinis]CAI7997889.1 unnamed protein product [Parascedosporium putredinis]